MTQRAEMPQRVLRLDQIELYESLSQGTSIERRQETRGCHIFEAARPVVTVRDNRDGQLVAYSCLNGDFEQSLEEFIRSYT